MCGMNVQVRIRITHKTAHLSALALIFPVFLHFRTGKADLEIHSLRMELHGSCF